LDKHQCISRLQSVSETKVKTSNDSVHTPLRVTS